MADGGWGLFYENYIGAAFGHAHVVCILLYTFHFAASERCELIAMHARPSLPFRAPGVCSRDSLASQTTTPRVAGGYR